MRGVISHPVLHFMILGGLLFAVRAGWRHLQPPAHAARPPVVITAAQVQALRADFQQRWGAPPSAPELQALLHQAIEDELLYQEARVLALDVADRSIRARLVQKMRAVSEDPSLDEERLYRAALQLGFDDDLVIKRLLRQKMRILLQEAPGAPPLSDEDLRAYLARHRDRYALAQMVSFSHVFLSSSRTAVAGRLGREAEATLADLRARAVPPDSAAARSDPFPLGSQMRARTRADVARYLGDDFAAQVMDLPLQTWSGPIASPFGLHLVFLHERIAAELPDLEAVRRQIASAAEQERAAARLEEGLRRLRGLYEVRVESDSGAAAPGRAS